MLDMQLPQLERMTRYVRQQTNLVVFTNELSRETTTVIVIMEPVLPTPIRTTIPIPTVAITTAIPT